MILNAFYALGGTLGFAILFNIRGKKLLFAPLGGAISWYFYLLLSSNDFSSMSSLFLASVVGGLYSEIMARVLKTPVTTLVICSIIPLVPGSGMYYTMLESIQGNLNNSLNTGFETIASAGAIAVGILLVSSLAKLTNIINTKKVSK